MDYQYAYPGFGLHLVMLIQTVIFLIPVLLLAYKQGGKDQVLVEVRKDLDDLEGKVSEQRDEHFKTLAELNVQIGNMRETLAGVTVNIGNLICAVKELKQKEGG